MPNKIGYPLQATKSMDFRIFRFLIVLSGVGLLVYSLSVGNLNALRSPMVLVWAALWYLLNKIEAVESKLEEIEDKLEEIQSETNESDSTEPDSEDCDSNTAIGVLVVEDEKSIRQFVVQVLSSEGFECFEVATGKRAMEVLESGVSIDLVLSNVLLPEMDGLTLLRAVKQKYRIPFVFITAVDDDEVRSEAMRDGANDYLLKPFTSEELLQSAHSAIANGANLNRVSR